MSSIHGVWAISIYLERQGETGGQRDTRHDDGPGRRHTNGPMLQCTHRNVLSVASYYPIIGPRNHSAKATVNSSR